jgi:uncharacterized protein (TIGR02145 family)
VKKILILIGIFCALKSNAQDCFLTFSGTGSSSTVSSVKVENLTSGTSLVMGGNDILHLTSITTGFNSIKNDPLSKIKIYPNPMTDYTTVQIYPPFASEAVLTILNITGNPAATCQYYFDNSRQDFRLSGLKAGLYLINVAGSNYQFSGKLVSTGEANGQITIEKVNSIAQLVERKAAEEKVSKGVQATVAMLYTPGDRLKFTGTSGNYSTVWIDIPTSDKTIAFDFVPCVDGDNNNYSVVEIGTQVWMAENLKTTRIRNGDLIETTTSATKNLLTEVMPVYQWAYGGNENNVLAFGRLYTWHTLAGNSICPMGWHVPTDADWETLTDYLGGLSLSGGKLKDVGNIHWNTPNTGATNETGYTALPGGYRFSTGGFAGLGNDGIWWSLTEDDLNEVWAQGISANSRDVYKSNNSKRFGYSVRCLKGEVQLLPVLNTKTVNSITLNTAISGGNVRSDGGAPITARGVCWSTSPNPTIGNNKSLNGTGSGSFTSPMTGLTANTSYYVRAYATNNIGTAYGNEVFLKTYTGTVTDIDGNVYNTVTMGSQVWLVENLKTTRYRNGDIIGTTTPATLDISGESTPKYQWAYDGNESNVDTYGRLYTGYALIDNRYVCPIGCHVPSYDDWEILFRNGDEYGGSGRSLVKSLAATSDWNTIEIPGTIGYDLTSNNSTGFTALPAGRRDNNTFRSIGHSAWWWSLGHILYPEDDNRVRIDYNNDNPETDNGSNFEGLSVRCLLGEVQLLPVLTTTAVRSITSTSVISGGNVTSDGGATVLYRGICWSTSPNPTIRNSKTIDGTGTGIFTSSITGLTANTTYYVRAYAINSGGAAYGNDLIFKTYAQTVTDIDGNIYNTVTIGTQLWMAENLKATEFNDGTPIPYITSWSIWIDLMTPAYCWYNNDAGSYKVIYGALYNWYVVDATSNGGKNVCPADWHVPTDVEWTTLTDYLGGENVAGGKLKEAGTTHWLSPNTGANNETGFGAIPSSRRTVNGSFPPTIGEEGYWWSCSKEDGTCLGRYMRYDDSKVHRGTINRSFGVSVRCLRSN